MDTFTTSNKSVRLKFTHKKYNGGFIMYWKLYFLMLAMTLKVFNIKKEFSRKFENLIHKNIGGYEQLKKQSVWNKIKFLLLFTLKTPWWLIVKPFGWIFVIQTYYKGEIYFHNEQFENISKNFCKVITIKIRSIPLFIFPWILTEKDIDMLIEKYA